MRKTILAFLSVLFLLTSVITFQIPAAADDNTGNVLLQVILPEPLTPHLSVDGKTLFNGLPLKAVVSDPNPSTTLRRIPAPVGLTAQPEAVTASFAITYISNGGSDLWGESCYTFPEEAKTAFNAAANIWSNTLNSGVPITIKACWGDLGSSSILGYSGGGPLRRDFTGATRSNTWYSGSLANALSGSDLDPGDFDMHITYNRNFNWFYGTDGNTPLTQYDLMSVVLHEIAHGLNFSGTMEYSSGEGRWGYGSGYPSIYDVFMRDSAGIQLINTSKYPNGSTALGRALVSNNIWFHGSDAMAANGSKRVKMYAPSTWSPGSSYSHLDYDTFNNTTNQLMVYAISPGESIHDPGVITRGLLQDLGWSSSAPTSNITLSPLYLLLFNASSPPIPNGDFESGAVTWTEFSALGFSLIGQWGTAHSGTWYTWLGGVDNETSYIQQQITVPSSSPYLAFYHLINSVDVCGGDNGYVRINGTTVDSTQLCTNTNTGGWIKKVVNLGAYTGQTVTLQIRAETDGSINSNWFIDDVSFQATASTATALEMESVPPKVDSASQFKTKKDLMKRR